MTTTDQHMRLKDIQASVRQARYVVDPRAVAEAMLRRAVEERAARLASPPGRCAPAPADPLRRGGARTR